jgi:hypothetical protein
MRINQANIEKRIGLPHHSTQAGFIAMEYWLLLLNRIFLVTVVDGVVCGAKIRGTTFSPKTPQENKPWYDLKFYLTEGVVERYRGIEPGSAQFMSLDRANFRLALREVRGAVFDPRQKFGMGYVPHTGRLYIQRNQVQKREFMLLGDQDGNDIAEQLNRLIQTPG